MFRSFSKKLTILALAISLPLSATTPETPESDKKEKSEGMSYITTGAITLASCAFLWLATHYALSDAPATATDTSGSGSEDRYVDFRRTMHRGFDPFGHNYDGFRSCYTQDHYEVPREKKRRPGVRDKRITNISRLDVFTSSGFNALRHVTHFDTLMDVLRDGHLKPTNKRSKKAGVFLELIPEAGRDGHDVVFIFRLSFLNDTRFPYLVTAGWNYGEYNPGSSVYSTESIAAFERMVDNAMEGNPGYHRNEVVLSQNLPFGSHFQELLIRRSAVPEDKMDELIALLKAKHIRYTLE